MASNERIRVILRLRGKIPQRQADLLLALETFTADGDGWREAGVDLIEQETGISPRTTAKARDEMVAAEWLDFDRGDGRGHVSRYRTRLPSVPKKGRKNATTFKGRQSATTFTAAKGRKRAPVKVANDPDKGRTRNPATSANANRALKELALKPSALSRAARDLGAALAALGATDDEIDFTIDGIKNSPRVQDPAAYMDGVVAKPGGVARLLDRTRRVLAEQDPADDTPTRPPRKPWCGNCDPDTRMIELPPDGRPMRCPDCGYAGAAPEPEPEPCPFGCVRGWIDADDDGPSRRCPEHRPGGRPF